MTLAELLPAVRALTDAEKRQLIETLSAELRQHVAESGNGLPGLDFLSYKPLEAYEAAATMQQMLESRKDRS